MIQFLWGEIMAVYTDEKIEFFDHARHSRGYRMSDAHFHNKHELYYLVKGKTKYFVENEIFILNEGDMIFVPKGVFHKTDSEEKKLTERFLFVFDDDFLGKDYLKYLDELKSDKYIQFPAEKLFIIQDIFNKIEYESSHKNSDYMTMQQLYLRQLLIFISRLRRKNAVKEVPHSYKIIQDAALYISSNVNADLSLKWLSRYFSVSPCYFSKLFKKVTGIGLNEYINVSRITAAEKMLTETKLPVTEVATLCGFNDSNYFASIFKRINDVTPKKYHLQNYCKDKNYKYVE